MFKRIFAVAAATSLSVLGATAAAQAQAQSGARPAGHLHGVRVVYLHRAYEAQLKHTKAGKISGIVFAKGHRPGATANAAVACTEPACPVAWKGGTVQHAPHVYLLLWGPKWTADPGHEASAAYLESFFSGLGVAPDDNWSTITSQYADGNGAPAFSGTVFKGAFNDPSTPRPNTSLVQIGAEADSFAEDQGITDLNDAQIIVATQSGTCPQGFKGAGCTGGTLPRNECGYHSSSNEAFINLPYVLDAGTNCGKDAVNPTPGGDNDGWSIVGGDLYASTITDPFPPTGWVDPNDGSEISAKCTTGFDLTLASSTTPFAVQTQWSNAASANGANGCVQTGAVKDSINITSPGSRVNNVGDNVNVPILGSSTAGNPLAWSQSGLPAGLTISATTGTVTGTPTTTGTFPVTVSATDETGAKNSVSFNWMINQAGKPITGDHGKCLDDFGGSTTNGNKVDIWDCNKTGSQRWLFSGGELSVLGKCLDDASQGGSGAKLVVWTCNGHAAQTWTHKTNGEYVLKLNGLCLTDPGGSATNGTQVVVRKCGNLADQHWTLPS